MSQTWVTSQNTILGLILGLNGPEFRAWNFDKNKNNNLVVENYSK